MTPLPIYTTAEGWFTLPEIRRMTSVLLGIDEDSAEMEAEMEECIMRRRQLIAERIADIDAQQN